MALPTLTPEQRAEALKKAAAARTARKELRDAIAAGKETIPSVLSRAKSDQIVGKTKVADLLKSLPGYGPAKVSALLAQTGIDASRRAPGLGDPQRASRGSRARGGRRHRGAMRIAPSRRITSPLSIGFATM